MLLSSSLALLALLCLVQLFVDVWVGCSQWRRFQAQGKAAAAAKLGLLGCDHAATTLLDAALLQQQQQAPSSSVEGALLGTVSLPEMPLGSSNVGATTATPTAGATRATMPPQLQHGVSLHLLRPTGEDVTSSTGVC